MYGRQFASQIGENRGRMLAFARKRIGAADAEDAVEETILRAWRMEDKYDRTTGDAGFTRWLFAIHRRVCSEATARRNRHAEVLESYRDNLPQAEIDPVNEPTDRRAIVSIVVNAALSHHQLICFTGYWLGVDYETMASCFGIAKSTVRKQVELSKRKLRASFKG